jgi:hypothetical protein
MSGPNITDQFRSLFTGYRDNYVKHTPPFKTNEDGKTTASWVGIAKYKTKSKFHPAPPEGFEDDDDIPLAADAYRDHLNGVMGLAVSPLMDVPDKTGVARQNVCYFAVIDIDVYGVDFTDLVARLGSYGYKFSAFISKSGGLHIYFFFAKAESAEEARGALKRIVETFGLHKTYSVGTTSRVEIFPMHAVRSPGVHDKCIFLPFYDSKGGSKQKMLTADGMLHKIDKAIPMIEGMFTSVSEISERTDALPYSDAPFCVQMFLLSGGPATNYNDFLFTASIFAKKKHGDAFSKEHIQEMNVVCEDPIEESKVAAMFTSVTGTDWSLKGRCGKEPVCAVCDKNLCKLRKFGVGRDKGNTVSNVEFARVFRVMTETPYYLWEARLSGTEEYKMLRIDGADNFLNQKTIQKACIDALGQLSVTVSPAIWEKTVNDCLLTIENLPAPKSTDTTEMAALKELFLRYLTHRQAQNKQPYTVNVRQVYHDGSAYYFKTDGFMDYLRTMKFVLGRTNLREQLIQYGCVEGEVKYTTSHGIEKSIPCWKKEDDAELKKLDTFYDDIMEADTEVLAASKLNKEDKVAAQADDNRF